MRLRAAGIAFTVEPAAIEHAITRRIDIHYPKPRVLSITQATELGLGSGGFDVLYANLTRGLRLPAAERAHVVALPYTPGQLATRFDRQLVPLDLSGERDRPQDA